MVSTVLFIGLGNMGRPMAAQLSRADFNLLVHDADPTRTRQVASELGTEGLLSLERIPSEVEATITMLPNSRIVEQVVQGLLSQLTAGALLIDMSSSEPESTKELSKACHQRGIAMVDAPVSGGVSRAETGDLGIMVGGAASAVDLVQPLLETMGGQITHVGGPGAGHTAKALNNLLSATNLAAAAEILSIASASGISPESMLNVINQSTGRSQASEFKYPNHILTGTFSSGFSMDLMLKDLRIATGVRDSLGVTAPVTDVTLQIAQAARDLLSEVSNPDHTETVKYYEHVNQVALRKKTPKE